MKSPFVVIPALGVMALLLHGAASLLNALPDLPSIQIGSPAGQVGENTESGGLRSEAVAPTTTTTFEDVPMDDSELSDFAVADDHMTLYENNYLPPVDETNRGVLRDLSSLHADIFGGAPINKEN